MPIVPVKKITGPIQPKVKGAAKSEAAAPSAPYVPIKKMTTPRTKIEAQIVKLRRMLDEMRAYKQILAETGMKPDDEDRKKESGIIKNLLSLEKQLDGTHRFKAVAPEKPAKKKPARRF
jgi:hypothetical protein